MIQSKPPKLGGGISFLTVFMQINGKLKQALDRRKIYSYQDIVNPKNYTLMKELNVPLQDIRSKMSEAQSKFDKVWDKPFVQSIESLPKLHNYSEVIKCLIAGNEGEIIEVSGEKASGKTCAMLEIARQYLKKTNKNILILNGSSGITKLRLEKLPFQRITYIDVYSLPSLIANVEEPPEQDIGMIIIDGFLKMLKSIQKPRQDLKAMMQRFKKRSDKIKYVIQNYTIADKSLSPNNKYVLNNPCEYSWIISTSCVNRVSTHKLSENQYILYLNKSKYGCLQQYQKFKITDLGYEPIND